MGSRHAYNTDGIGWVWGTSTRVAAYGVLKRRFPESLGILEVARIAADMESSLGHCAPFVIPVAAERWALRYMMDLQDARDALFLERLRAYAGEKNEGVLREIKETDFFRTPDFTLKMFDFHPPPDLVDVL